MRPFQLLALVVLMILASNDNTARAQGADEVSGRGPGQKAPVARVGDQSVAFAAGDRALRLPVFADRPIDRPAPDVRRAVVVLHGTMRNADVYLDGMAAAVAAAGLTAETLVVAPQFLADVDAAPHALADDQPRWSLDGWKEGAGATGPDGLDPAAASSFAALDAVLGHFADRARFPALARVIVAGHSAGGQVLARYAPAGRGDAALTAAGVAVRYVIANPSSYLYFDARRPLADGAGFAVPEATDCARFDRYKYGLRRPVPYLRDGPAAAMIGRFLARDVVYLLGAEDRDPGHRFLDRTCSARLQGPHRLGRGQNYFNYLKLLSGEAELKHRLIEVPGVGHDNRAMFGSAAGRAALFGD